MSFKKVFFCIWERFKCSVLGTILDRLEVNGIVVEV